MQPAPPRLTERFLAALSLAAEVHGDQRRHGTQVPYMAHVLIVAGLVLEAGGDEDGAIAAVLHDTVEDGGGRPLLERIEAEFGGDVAAVVAACSDTLEPDSDGRSWKQRKESHLRHLATVSDDAVLRVMLADKVHNARSIVRDYRSEGDALWERFANRTPDDQLWYYDELVRLFSERAEGPLFGDLRRAVDELRHLVAEARRDGTPAGS